MKKRHKDLQYKDDYSSLDGSVYINGKEIDKYYSRLDQNQKDYYENFFKDNIEMVCVNASAGTGKTTIAVMAALELLRQGKISKIYYVRFPDDRSLRTGFLPGTESDKTTIYTLPFYNACEEFGIIEQTLERWKCTGIIHLCTDIAMRGSNISDAMVIIDEAQNSRFADLKLVLTRITDNCKCALIGHSGQIDNFKGKNDHAFTRYIDHMCKKPWAVQCSLPVNYRGKLSTWADALLSEEDEEDDSPSRPLSYNDDFDDDLFKPDIMYN